MGVDPRKRLGAALPGLIARLLRLVLFLVGRLCRYRVVAGQEHLDALRSSPQPVVLSFWHNRSLLAAPFLLRKLHRRGLEVTVLASHSRDGELVARLAAQLRLRTVRGSATRGGLEAIRALYRAIVRHQGSPVVIPDGPTGPLYEFKVGAAVLSQMSGAPVLPVGFAAAGRWRLRSWDRLRVPRPFTRIAVAVGSPTAVPRGLSAEALEAQRQRFESELASLTRQAEAAVGVADPEAAG